MYLAFDEIYHQLRAAIPNNPTPQEVNSLSYPFSEVQDYHFLWLGYQYPITLLDFFNYQLVDYNSMPLEHRF